MMRVNNALRRFSIRQLCCRGGFALAGCLAFVQVASAQTPVGDAYLAGLNGFTRTLGASGQAIYIAPAVIDAKTIGSSFVQAASAGGAVVSSTASLPFGSASAGVALKGVATGAAVFNTFKTILGGPVGIGVTALSLTPALVDWLLAGDARFSPGKPGEVERRVPGNCPVGAICTQFTMQPSTIKYTDSTAQGVCDQVAAKYASINEAMYRGAKGTAITEAQCSIDSPYPYGNLVTLPIGKVSGFIPDKVWVPATIEEIRAQMEKTPSTTAAINALISKGGSIPISYAPGAAPDVGVKLSAPSVTEVPVVERVVSGDPSSPAVTTTTKTVKTDLTTGTTADPATGQLLPSVTGVTTASTVTNTCVGTSACSSVTSTTNAPAKAVEPTPDPCKENPNRVGCMETDQPTQDIPKTSKDVTYAPESHFGGGSCPADKMLILHGGQSVKVFDWASACGYVSGYFRPLLLAIAAFVALMILAPGVKT
jgi:hypothetical protein